MENTENTQPTKEQRMQQEATKILDGDERLSKELVEYAKDSTKVFADEFSDLMKKHILKMKADTERMTSSIRDEEKKAALNSLVIINIIDELVSIMLMSAANCAITSHIKMSLFIFKAAERFESAVVERTMSSMSEKIMEVMMSLRPEPDKENLS